MPFFKVIENTGAPLEIQQSLDVSWKEGIAAQVMLTMLDYYVIPLALLLDATPHQIGLLVAIPHIIGAVAQLIAARLVALIGSRLRFLLRATITQAIIVIPIACLALVRLRLSIGWLIVFIVIYRTIGNLIGTVWGSLASDYLPAEQRGKYFGWRTQITGVAGIVSLIFGGLWLNGLKHTATHFSFFLLFLIAAAARLVSAKLMSKMADLPLEHKPEANFGFFRFIARYRESNFVKFVFYVSAILFGANLAAPFFSVYMLRDLHFNYLAYTVIQMAPVITGILSYPLWGQHADMVGNAKVLKTTGLLVPLIPLFWTFSHYLPYLIVIELFSGFIWGGFNFCAVNFIYDAVSPEKRVRCLGYFSLISSIALFTGAWLGGILAENLPAINGSPILMLFLISFLVRALAHYFLSNRFQEVRKETRDISSFDLFFSVVGLKPAGSNGIEQNTAGEAE
ncbi:MAG: MFS transporter [Candidatus Omnitrophica bacterium]|nr:MFS transporter [Candidatus Omnitrophota bacterium]MDD5671985.1 MFS transporter [Candidatus Omnitrophota bacterium]